MSAGHRYSTAEPVYGWQWYRYRNHRNIFDEFTANKDVNNDAFLNALMNAPNANYFHKLNINMPFLNAVKTIINSGFVKKIIIYTENNEIGVNEFIDTNIGSGLVSYIHGDLTECLRNIPIDSTYVFSDVMKINNLIESDHINYSSFIIAANLRYNYKEDDKTQLKIDLDKLSENYVFKPAFFNTFPK